MNPEVSKKFGEEYLIWKEWGEHGSFGELNSLQDAYYRAEVRKSGLGSINRVLEIGFGNGSFLAFCKRNAWHVVGTEENVALVALARERGFEAVAADALAASGSGSWDLIAAFDVLEHIEQATLPGILLTIRELLRPGGVFVARFPNGDSPLGLQIQHGDVTHVTTLGSGKVEYFARALGFELISMGGAAQPVFGGRLLNTLRRMVIVPAKKLLETLFRVLFFPGTRVAYLSPSLVVCLRKPLQENGTC